MGVANEGGRGRYIGKETASTTIEITPGNIVELNSTGECMLPTATAGAIFGVAASKVASRTTASKKKILIQRSGIAHVSCLANETFAYGEVVVAGTTGGLATSHALDCSTLNPQLIVGKLSTTDDTTEGTTVVVSMWP